MKGILFVLAVAMLSCPTAWSADKPESEKKTKVQAPSVIEDAGAVKERKGIKETTSIGDTRGLKETGAGTSRMKEVSPSGLKEMKGLKESGDLKELKGLKETMGAEGKRGFRTTGAGAGRGKGATPSRLKEIKELKEGKKIGGAAESGSFGAEGGQGVGGFVPGDRKDPGAYRFGDGDSGRRPSSSPGRGQGAYEMGGPKYNDKGDKVLPDGSISGAGGGGGFSGNRSGAGSKDSQVRFGAGGSTYQTGGPKDNDKGDKVLPDGSIAGAGGGGGFSGNRSGAGSKDSQVRFGAGGSTYQTGGPKDNEKGDKVLPDGSIAGAGGGGGFSGNRSGAGSKDSQVRFGAGGSTYQTGGAKDNEKGDKVLPGGTIHGAGDSAGDGGSMPSYDDRSDTFSYSDGRRVRGSDPQGRRGKANPDGSIDYPDSTRVYHDTDTGRTEVHHPDGSADIHDEHGGYLQTGPGTATSRSDDGGTTVHDPKTGATAHFGPGESEYVEGGSKDDSSDSGGSGGGSDDSSSGSGGGSDDSSSGSGGGSDDSGSDDSSDSGSDDSGSDDSSDSGSDDSGSGDSGDSGSDDSGGGDELTSGDGGSGGVSPTPEGIARRTDPGYRERDSASARPDCGDTSAGEQGYGTSQPGAGAEQKGACPPEGTMDADEDHPPAYPIPAASGKNGPYKPVDPGRHGDDIGVGGRTFDPFEGIEATRDPAPDH